MKKKFGNDETMNAAEFSLGLILLLLLAFACNKKEPPKVETATVYKVEVGSCYRYPNVDQQDVHTKVMKVYSNYGFMGEFIVEKSKPFKSVLSDGLSNRHVKKVDCEMYDDLRSIVSEPNG